MKNASSKPVNHSDRISRRLIAGLLKDAGHSESEAQAGTSGARTAGFVVSQISDYVVGVSHAGEGSSVGGVPQIWLYAKSLAVLSDVYPLQIDTCEGYLAVRSGLS